MRLVVGEAPDHATPMLASRITGIVFRPYWVPTPAILREEILPRERAKPGWLAAHGMEIVASGEDGALALEPDEQNLQAAEHGRLTVRQRPGPRNDLGPVKFVVPNPACIGLHGTPHRRIFERPRRDRSHGCVRLEDPVALAVWVLRGQDGWDRARVEAAIRRDRPTGVRLREPVSLAVTYATASVDPDGSEHFSEDIYGLDADLEARLAARRAR
jgi:murein L,D-transpeptidase YcbB/YkuD